MAKEGIQYVLLPKVFSDRSDLVAVGMMRTGWNKENLTQLSLYQARGEELKIMDAGHELSRHGGLELGVEELWRREIAYLAQIAENERQEMAWFLINGRIDVEKMRNMARKSRIMNPKVEDKVVKRIVEENFPPKVGNSTFENMKSAWVGLFEPYIEELALIAGAKGCDIRNILIMEGRKIVVNYTGITYENMELLASYFLAENRIRVASMGDLYGQSQKAREIILKCRTKKEIL